MYVPFCPKCKSTDVSSIVVGEDFTRFTCNKCKYTNLIFPEADIKVNTK